MEQSAGVSGLRCPAMVGLWLIIVSLLVFDPTRLVDLRWRS